MPDQDADEYVVSDPELITRVRTGDREAFGELYRRHSGPATVLSRQFARSPSESDDLVSESFARVLDNLLAGKGPDTAFRAYLFTTIRNTAYDKTRKDKRLQFTDDMSTHDVAVLGADPVLARMENGLVATAFAQLPERWQAVLWHTQVEGESPATVGAMLGMAPGAVSSLAFRAREGLREAYLQAHLAETAADRCRSTVERLGSWTRGGLSKREKAQVDAHLEECDRCRALGVELNEVNHGLRGLLAPLLLGGAAAGYIATLGPVAPLAVPGALLAGGAGSAATAGGAAGGTSAAGAGAGAAAGTGAAAGAGSVGAAAGAGGAGAAGAAGGGAALGAGTAGAAAASGVAASAAGTTAAAAAAAATTVGMSAMAHASGTGTAGGTGAGVAAGTGGAAGTGSVAGGAAGVGAGAGSAGAAGVAGAGATGVGATATGAAAAGAAAATGASAVGGAAAVGGVAAAGGAAVGGAAAGGAAVVGGMAAAGGAAALGGAAAVGGISGVLAGVSVGGLVAAGAAVVAAGVTAVALIANSPSNTVDAAAGPTESAVVQTTAAGTTGGFFDSTDPASIISIPSGDGTTSIPTATSQAGLEGLPVLTPAPTSVEPTTSVQATEPLIPASPVPAVETPTPVALVTDVPVTDAPATDAPDTGVPSTEAPVEPILPSTTDAPPPATSEVPVAPTDPTVVTSPDPPTEPSTPVPPPPANLLLSNVNASLTAGEVGSATVTITNTGGQPSDPQSLNLRPPDGVEVTDADVTLQSPGFRRATAGLLRTGPVPCSAGSCSVDLPAVPDGGAVTVTLTIRVPVTGSNGNLVFAVGSRETSLPIAVPAAPADVRISGPNRSAATAGGVGGFVVTVRNVGGTAATAQGVRFSMPPGVTVTGIEAEGRPTCADVTDCTLDSVNPGDAFRLTVRVAAGFDAATVTDGVTLEVGGSSLMFTLPIRQPITALTTGGAALVADGSRQQLELTATTIANVNGARVTFTARPDTVTLDGNGNGSGYGCDGDGLTLTCTLNEGPISLGVLVPSGLPTGDLPVTATDSAGRVIPILGAGDPVRIVQPAKVLVSELGVAGPFIAGGTGRLTATVTNSGGVDVTNLPVEIGLPAGVTVERVAAGERQICGPGTCVLDVLSAGQTVSLDILVRLTPTAEPGAVRLAVGGSSRELTVAIDGGVTALVGSSAGPLIADGEARQVTFRQRTVGGDVEPGPVTLTAGGEVTFGAGNDCTSEGPTVITCAAGAFTVPVIVGAGQAAGPLPVTVADHYGNNVSLIGADDRELSVQARPARLSFSEVASAAPVPAGGSGTVRFSVRNTGGTGSLPQDLTVVPPTGLTVTSIAVAGSSACTGTDTCTLPTIEPAGSLDVEIQFAVSATAGQGPLTIAISAADAELTTTIGVRGGIASVSAQYSAALIPGATTIVPVTVGPVDGVTETGPVTVTAPDGGIGFESTPGCSPVPAGALCSGSSFDLAIAVPLDQRPGAIRLTATDAGGRSVDVTGPTGGPLQVAARRLTLSGIDVQQPYPWLTVLRVAVHNPAQVASADMPIDVTVSTGVRLLGVRASGQDLCSPLLTTCRLAPVAPGGSTTVDLLLGAWQDTTATVEVTIDGSTRSATFEARGGYRPDGMPAAGTTAEPAAPAPGAEPLANAVLLTDLIEPAIPAPDGLPVDGAPDGGTPSDTIPGTTDPDNSVLAGSPGDATPTTPENQPADVTSNEPGAPADGAGTTDASPADALPTTTGTTDTTDRTEATGPAAQPTSPEDTSATDSGTMTTAPDTGTTTDDPASSGGESSTPTSDPSATAGDVAGTIDTPGPTPITDTPVEPTSDEPTTAEPTTAEPTTAEPTTATDTAPAAVADLVVSEPWVTQPLVAGANPGEIRFTVSNTGGGASAEQPLTAVLPTGVTMIDMHVDGAAGGQTAAALPPIAAGSAVTVVITIAVDSQAVPGDATLSLDGPDLSWNVPIQLLPAPTGSTG